MTSEQQRIEPKYISAGCNRCAKALDWGGRENQIIFGQSRAVALMSPVVGDSQTAADDEFEIKCTFGAHTDTVNCVRWIRRGLLSSDHSSTLLVDEFVSGSKDKSIVVWRGSRLNYECSQVLNGHTASVNVLDAIYLDTDDDEGVVTTHIASASVDSTVRIWTRKPVSVSKLNTEKFDQEQVLTSKGHGFALALKFYQLPISKSTFLLIGYENHKIELHVRLDKEAPHHFELHHTLVGHEDWIQDIDVCQISSTQLLIASCSQDHYIRLWKLDAAPTKLQEEREVVADKDDEDDVDDDDDEEENKVPVDEDLKLKSSHFIIYSKRASSNIEYSMSLESVLYGHEDWIYSVRFQPPPVAREKGENKQPLTLISASMDKTMVVWSYNEENAVWIDVARAGDIGGTTLGFYGATFDVTGRFIVAHGYQGALHLWSRDFDSKTESLSPAVINSGHFEAVEDLSWEPEQHYLISTSKDQTSRFHGEWRRHGRSSWHELGRPQIHGYDMQCVAFIDRFRFVSGADEKLLRVFACPLVFLKNYYRLSGDESVRAFVDAPTESMPKGASVPALGLSNKAVFDQAEANETGDDKGPNLAEELYKEVYFNVIDLNKPPTEEHLLQNTLWPEMQKLYGHGYELFSVACEPRSRLIASACKASKPEHARILLWQQQQQQKSISRNSQQFKQVGELAGHELTIVQLKFSPSGRLLLSVSRDRSWKLFEKTTANEEEEISMRLVNGLATKNSFHTRIVWSCDWSHDERYFVTTSRDKRVCIWETQTTLKQNDSPPTPLITKPGSTDLFLELSDSVTASAFAPDFTSDKKNYLLAFGLENGTIEIYKWNSQEGFSKYAQVENRFSHHMTVKRLTFRRLFESTTTTKTFCLASCSDDFSVRLFNIRA